jgi:thiol-disulfide isomerase/thioredoxin
MARGSTLKQIKRLAARARKTMRKRKPYLRHRNTTTGRVLPPIDIRNPSGIGELLKRIRKGPVTIVLVYADWCGHCKEFKPIFENAEKSPNRTAQTVKVNDVMFPQVTDAIKNRLNMNATPMSVEGYPSVILVDKKGNMIQNVAAVKEQSTMNKLMESAGTLAEKSVSKTPNSARSNMTAEDEYEDEDEDPSSVNAMVGKPLPPIRVSKNSMAPSANVASVSANVEKSIGSFRNSKTKAASIENEQKVTSVPPVASAGSDANEVSVTTPPGSALLKEDMVSDNTDVTRMRTRQGGGGLLAALGSSAYQLAPAGVLLALAATMKRRGRGRGRGRRVKTQRRR